MAHFCQNLLTESDLERIDQAVFRILGEQGGWFQNPQVLRALDKAGCEVDYQQETARMPEGYLREVIEASKSFARPETARYPEGYGRDIVEVAKAPARSDFDPTTGAEPYGISIGGEQAQFVFDYDQFEKHSSTRDDLIALAKWAYALNDGKEGVGPVVRKQDEPAAIEPLVAASQLDEYPGERPIVIPLAVLQLD